MSNKNIDFDKLNKIYSDGENDIYDVRGTEYSMFHQHKEGYVIDENVVFGKDYPSGLVDKDMFHILVLLKEDLSLDEILQNLQLESSFTEVMIKEIMISHNLIEETAFNLENDIEKISKMSSVELSEILKKSGIIASGKKKKLVKLVFEKCSSKDIGTGEYIITSEGENFLEKFEWILIYDFCLENFLFDDFYKYLDELETSDDNIQNALDYLDEHIKHAKQKEDFFYLNNCYESRLLIYHFIKDYEACLNESIKIFILRINPVYDFEEIYKEYRMFEELIEEIIDLQSHTDGNLKELFDKNWQTKDCDKEFISKTEAFNLLERLLSGDDVCEFSQNYYEKYLKVNT